MMLVWVFCGVFMRSSISRCVVLKITLSVIMWYTISNNGEGRGVGGETWCYVAIFSFCYLQHRTWRKRKFVQLVNCSILSWDYVPFFPHCKSDKRPGGGGPGNSLGTRHIVACIVNHLFGSHYKRRIQEKRGVTGGGKGWGEIAMVLV